MIHAALTWVSIACGSFLAAIPVPVVDVEGQPLAANVDRLLDALDVLGTPLPEADRTKLRDASRARDSATLQRLLDRHVLCVVTINPEARVKVARGPAPAVLQQAGYTPVLVKVLNEGAVTPALRVVSPQAGTPYAGELLFSLQRQEQTELKSPEPPADRAGRFLAVEMVREPPLTPQLSGLAVEYAVALIYSSEAGAREATIGFDLGQLNQDLGFRGEVPILFEIRPAKPVTLSIRDVDGAPTIARLTIRDPLGRVHPPQPRRVAPDLFFQPHIYRNDGEVVWLPPGEYRVEASRGPEYVIQQQTLHVSADGEPRWEFSLERWIDAVKFGFFSGDHHIHGAGCAHYTRPSEGVSPLDMFRQVKGEGLNVGCVLTWGPCFDYQRKYFAPAVDALSEPHTRLKYDLEISGFGSQALGHVCLLNLKDQVYPGSDGSSQRGWPTWTTPVMRWAKEQGGVTGYAHSASGLAINPKTESQRLIQKLDTSGDGRLVAEEVGDSLLPDAFTRLDADRDGGLDANDLVRGLERVAEQLPNYAIPEMNGVGAMEICVSTVAGVCDFISAMDTERVQEWNTWYHLLNAGFPLKVSGETDFPCMSSLQVGQGRVYVQLGAVKELDFAAWCRGLADGRSYVSDGYAHAVQFAVNDVVPGPQPLELAAASKVHVSAQVAFAPQTPKGVAHGNLAAPEGTRVMGDTRILHVPRTRELEQGGTRRVELIVNGLVAAQQTVPADGRIHDLTFDVPIDRSSWIALRQFPQLHTNPVTVLVNQQPLRASRRSALWCAEMTQVLWRNREKNISQPERAAAREAFDRAIERLKSIANECSPGT